jgi:hypothetical protein
MPHRASWLTGLLAWLAATLPSMASDLCAEPAKGFGGVPRGTVLTHQFRLTNPGPQSLHVAEVRTSCECSTVDIAQKDIPPGGTVPVTVTVKTALYAGTRTFTIFVAFDRPIKKEEQLRVSATSLEDVMVEPGVVNFGRVRPGQEMETSVRIDYRGGMEGWALTTVDQENPHFQARFEQLKRKPGLVQYRLHVKLKGTLPPGTWRLPVYLRTNDPYFPRLSVALEAEMPSALTVTPAVLQLGPVAASASLERKITVRGPKPFRVLRVECADARCTVQGLTNEAKQVHVLTVRFTAGTDAADTNLHIVLHTDLAEQPRADCHVQAQGAR